MLWLPASLLPSKKGELNILNLLITLRILGSHFVYTSTFKMATKLQRTQQSLVSSVYRSPSDASKAELYKLGFSKAFYASDGQIPQKVIVTLMSKPFITNAAKPFGAVGDAKRSVGRPPKKN